MQITTYAPWGGVMAVVAALVGCGGSGSDNPPPEKLPLGEVLTFGSVAQDGSTQEQHYLVHGVSAAGDLVAHDANGLLPDQWIALPLETAQTPESDPQIAVLRGFYKQLWQAIASHRKGSPDIAAEIDAYETDIGTLYADFQRSGFATVTDYVAFYEQAGEHPFFDGQEALEEQLLTFFYATGWSQGAWLQALRNRQWDWPRFLDLMAQRKQTFADLLAQHQTWRQDGAFSVDEFVMRYVGSPRLAKNRELSKDGVFYISKNKWSFWPKDPYAGYIPNPVVVGTGIPEAYWLYHDGAPFYYGCRSKVYLHGRHHVVQMRMEYGIEFFRAMHGDWLSKILVDVTKEPVSGGFFSDGAVKRITGRAEIKDVHNVGTAENPKPRFNLLIKFNIPIIYNTKTWVINNVVDMSKDGVCSVN